MKQVGLAILVVLILNLLVLGGFIAWLGGSGRLSRERLQKVVEVFTPTIEQERLRLEEEAQLEAESAERARQAARLEAVSGGARTLEQKLDEEDLANELQARMLDRLTAESAAIRRRLESSKQVIAQLKAELDAERQALQDTIEAETQKRTSEDFQQAVAFYEQLSPKQAKGAFQALLAQGKTDEVLDYLGAMQLRKAGAVLRQFKTQEEIVQAAMLLEALRDRGVDTSAMRAASIGGGV